MPVECLEKLRECFSLESKNTHRTLASEASDAEPARSVYCQFLVRLSSALWTHTSDVGRTLFVRPVMHDVSSKFASVSNSDHRMPRRASDGCV